MTNDLTGRVFSDLTVLMRQGSKNGASYWLCKCHCGNGKLVKAGHLKDGGVKSCGCLRGTTCKRLFTKHGQCRGGLRTKEYKQQEFARYRKRLEALHGADWWRHSAQYLYALKHPEIVKLRHRKYRQNNKASVLAATRERQARQLRATPAWANKAAIKAFYEEARRMTEATGIPHEVDHIVPLRGKLVWGFHIEGNLQVIPATMNRRKWNKVMM